MVINLLSLSLSLQMKGENMSDPTEEIRRQRMAELNKVCADRIALEAQFGQVWDTDQMCTDFDVKGFMAPLVVVRRKTDKKMGSLEFQANPRYYFNFQPHKE